MSVVFVVTTVDVVTVQQIDISKNVSAIFREQNSNSNLNCDYFLKMNFCAYLHESIIKITMHSLYIITNTRHKENISKLFLNTVPAIKE